MALQYSQSVDDTPAYCYVPGKAWLVFFSISCPSERFGFSRKLFSLEEFLRSYSLSQARVPYFNLKSQLR
ncbi:hypothetical protein R1flu_018831 [Riccia fluitans]|uniref:Uncharacterized protein n=1 Tax=Riccia fluitans TaxID=41844 RepID=A0ABD1ZH47_9MARC